MSTVQTRFGKVTRRTFETSSVVILIILLALPFTKAFADDYRYGRGGPGFVGASSVPGWRLGGDYRTGGYEIWYRFRGDWRRAPGRGVQLGGNPRSPWVINSQGERYQWTGRDWRFVGYANGRGYNRRNNPPVSAFRNNRGSNRWFENRGYRNDRYYDRNYNRNYDRRDNRRGVVRQQRNRIERQQDRIQDLRRDLRRERAEDRWEDRRDRIRRENRRDRVQDRREDRRDRAQDRRENRREDRPRNNGRPNRDGGPR